VRREHLFSNHLVRVRLGDTIDYTIPSSPTYGKPTNPLDYPEPLPANGDRTPSPKSPFNYRGTMVSAVNDDGPRILTFESSIEHKAALIFQADHRIVELRTQWPTVEYRGPDGVLHKHIFDFYMKRDDGKRIVVAAKPIAKMLETDLVGTLLRISKQRDIKRFADAVTFVTEKFASDEATYNAKEILLSRRLHNDDEYRLALDVLRGVRGPVTFRALFAGAEVPAHRRIALWRLVDHGFLRPAAPGRIEDTTTMTITL
jgi:hypothetical protein